MIEKSNNIFSFSDVDILHLLEDIADAQRLSLPGDAKHAWVVAQQIRRNLQSPPPPWIWLLLRLLEELIPFLIDYLKKNYGNAWLPELLRLIQKGDLPWQ